MKKMNFLYLKISLVIVTGLAVVLPALAQNTFPARGKVGLGTTAPAALLSIGASSQFQVDELGHVTASEFTARSGSSLILSSGDPGHSLVLKGSQTGAPLLLLGGAYQDIAPQTDIVLPGGEWGSGALVNGLAPIFQNAVFSGTTQSEAAGFGLFLQQTDNSACGHSGCVGISEHLILNGSSVVGSREGAQVNIDIALPTGNLSGKDYVAIGSKCNLMATDAGGNSIYRPTNCRRERIHLRNAGHA